MRQQLRGKHRGSSRSAGGNSPGCNPGGMQQAHLDAFVRHCHRLDGGLQVAGVADHVCRGSGADSTFVSKEQSRRLPVLPRMPCGEKRRLSNQAFCMCMH